MRYFAISEEDLKYFIRTSKRFGFACESVLYCPTEEELEVTEEDLKRYKELKDYIEEQEEPEEPDMSLSTDKYAGMKAVSDWIKNCPSEEFMRTFNELKGDYSGPTIGDFLGDEEEEND